MKTDSKLDVHPYTDRGQREYQEDFFYTDPPAKRGVPWLGVLSDGMGGHKGGDLASKAGVHAIKRAFDACIAKRMRTEDALVEATTEGHKAVLQAAEQAGALGNMGATVVAFVVENGVLHWCSAGDSRLYLFRDGRIEQLSRDFTLGEDMRRGAANGDWSEEDIAKSPQRNALTSFMGTNAWRTDVGHCPLQHGDVIVACSDGVYGTINAEGIAAACGAVDGMASAQQIAETLQRRVLEVAKPNQDNSTAIVARYFSRPQALRPAVRPVEPTIISGPPQPQPQPQPRRGRWIALASTLGLVAVIAAGGIVYKRFQSANANANANANQNANANANADAKPKANTNAATVKQPTPTTPTASECSTVRDIQSEILKVEIVGKFGVQYIKNKYQRIAEIRQKIPNTCREESKKLNFELDNVLIKTMKIALDSDSDANLCKQDRLLIFQATQSEVEQLSFVSEEHRNVVIDLVRQAQTAVTAEEKAKDDCVEHSAPRGGVSASKPNPAASKNIAKGEGQPTVVQPSVGTPTPQQPVQSPPQLETGGSPATPNITNTDTPAPATPVAGNGAAAAVEGVSAPHKKANRSLQR